KVEALDSGADDYITKPFHINELLARVRVALRKKEVKLSKNKQYRIKELTIDNEKHKVFLENKEIHLTPIEFNLLLLLVENAGKVLTHSFIIHKIWGYSGNEDSLSLRVFMASIRRKIEKDSSHPHFILTEVGVGYRFVDEIDLN
ncbi:MAG: response regulator transcription factor, partial [Erysipelotrichaceae bacterium]